MGELKIKGTAQRTVRYDRMVVCIEFTSNGDTPSQASKKVMEECENYLDRVKEKGFDIKKIALRNDSVRQQTRYNTNEQIEYFEASRKVEMRIAFDMRAVNTLRRLSDDLGMNCLFQTNYELSNAQKIREELQLEALRSAKAQAEILAEAVGQRVTGLKSADKDAPRRKEEIYSEMDGLLQCLCCGQEEPYEKTNELAAKEIELTEDIYTVWEIE